MTVDRANSPDRRVRLIAALAGIALMAGCAANPAPEDASAAPAEDSAEAPRNAPRVSAELAQTPFGRAIAQAVRTSPDRTAAGARVQEAEADLQAESGAFLPQVSLGAEATTTLAGTSQATPLLRVRQLIYDGGASAGRRSAAQARVVQSQSDRLSTLASTTYETVETYHDLRSARQRLDLARRNEATHRRFLEQVEDRAAAGAGAGPDVLTARSRLANATTRAVEAQARVDRAISAYQRAFGEAPPASIGAAPTAPRLPEGSDAEIIDASPRLRSLQASITAAEADLATARAGRRPAVSLGATGRRGVGERRVDGSLSLEVDYDLGTQGRQAAAIRAAEARLQTLEAERDSLTRDIASALADLRADQRAGAARLSAARDAVRANEESVEAAREQFSIGRQSLAGLLDAQRDLFEASESLIAAERELALTGYAALSLTGDILDAFGIDPRATRVEHVGQ